MHTPQPINTPRVSATTGARLIAAIEHWRETKAFRKYMHGWQRRYRSQVLARSFMW